MTGGYATSCPSCGGPMTSGMWPGYQGGYGPGFGYPGPMWGGFPGAYYPAYYPPMGWAGAGVPTDDQITQMIYDTIDADPAVPYDSNVNVDVTGGVVTLTGSVPNKRVKHDVGDDAWWVPGVWDINNELQVVPRARRAEQPRERKTK